MDCIELDIEVVVADEAFDIHPPHPDVELTPEHMEAVGLDDIPY